MQAAVITAYKNFDQLFELVNMLLNGNFKIFIHIDKKQYVETDPFLLKLKEMKNVQLYSEYVIEWGSINHLYAILKLLTVATTDSDIHFIHIISSQDYPVKPLAYYEDLFSSTNKCIYMTTTPLELFNEEVKNRFEQYYFFNKCDSRNQSIQHKEKCIQRIQKKLGIKRTKFGKFKSLYKGMVWISAPSEVFRYTLESKKEKNSLLKFLKYCKIPEEFFFQTMIMNSNYRTLVVKDNLRYTVWQEKHGSIPAILDIEDWDNINKTNAIFARKLDSEISLELKLKIDKSLVN